MGRFGIYLLTVGVFLAVTSELMLIGVTDWVARDLRVPLSFIGYLITAYALAFAVGTPVVITLSAKLERKKLMLAAFSLFIFANLVSSWSTDFAVLVCARALLGLSGGVFAVAAMGVVSKLVPPDQVGSAIGTVVMGLSGSLVFGVPFGIVLSGLFHWQFAFAAIASLSALIWLGILLTIPPIPGGEPVPLRKQLSVFTDKRIVSDLLITLLINAGSQTVYTFLTPLLQTTNPMNTWMISITMFILGIFSMVGSRLGGYGADRFGAAKTVCFSLVIHAMTLLLLPALMASAATAVFALSAWMAFNWMASPAMQTYFIQQAPQNPDLALSLNTSFTQLGIASGAALGGWVVNATGNVVQTAWAGGLIVLMAVGVSWFAFSVRSKPSASKA